MSKIDIFLSAREDAMFAAYLCSEEASHINGQAFRVERDALLVGCVALRGGSCFRQQAFALREKLRGVNLREAEEAELNRRAKDMVFNTLTGDQ